MVWTGSGSIAGFDGGKDGQRLVIFNDNGANAMSIVDESHGSTDATTGNRFLLLDGSTIKSTTGTGMYEFVYSGTKSRWILINFIA